MSILSDARELSHEEAKALRKASTASFIGNFVEWFDYASYGYLAVVIGTVFFPSEDKTIELLSTYAVFAVSFILRPIGGIIWGALGDKLGRRFALAWSILIMSGATFLLGCLPSYAAAGVAAPILLIIIRMVQGFSASGEYAGAATFLSEYAPSKNRGFYTSLVPASTATGLLLGSLLVALLTWGLTPDDLATWGWRIPFLLAGPLGLVGRYVRLHLEDSPVYTEMLEKLEKKNEEVPSPIKELFKNHKKKFFIALGVASLNAVGFYIVLSYMPVYLATERGVAQANSLLAATVSTVVYILSIFVMGHLSDIIGRRKMLIIASLLFIFLSIPLFMMLDANHIGLILLVQMIFGVMLTTNDGTLATFLSELFPTSIRYTGFAFSFNTANALFGGTAPFISTWMINTTGSVYAPAVLLSIAGVVALVAMLASKETAFRELQH
ncbi:MFS transporter [Actinomyces sp. zg-332]|uniref:MFS transporter n=1 Tax=Actinomyces sp. zg-332 TaxID=2708340 RepID=UPI001424710A|nr:MFS transporter [Actinomyces sp. zg-332]QPK94026.1 MFS transporter [Actinomyces sp. zg-332]